MESPMATSTTSGSASLGACDAVSGGLPLGCVDGAPLEHAASSSVRAMGRTRGTEGSGISGSRAPTAPSPALPGVAKDRAVKAFGELVQRGAQTLDGLAFGR